MPTASPTITHPHLSANFHADSEKTSNSGIGMQEPRFHQGCQERTSLLETQIMI